MVRIHPDPPPQVTAVRQQVTEGAVAQLGERLLCKQEAVGSIPSGSTTELTPVTHYLIPVTWCASRRPSVRSRPAPPVAGIRNQTTGISNGVSSGASFN